jgi:type III pantothenate kinase
VNDLLLAIDVGNTNIVLGVYRDETQLTRWRLQTVPGRTADEHAVILRSLCAANDIDFGTLRNLVVGSVVPTLTATFADLADRYLSARPVVVGPGIKTGIRLLVENPREVGADRIANTVAAHRRFGGPAIVVDFGTATTFDAISSEGDFLGGAIAPGLEISQQALFDRAARLYRVDLQRPRTAIGKNTATNLQSGILFGYVGLVEGLISRMRAELGTATVIGTGGLVDLIAAETGVFDHVDRELTLEGLRVLWELNR